MQELAKEIDAITEHGGGEWNLRDSAKKWAGHCVENYNGDLLAAGLKVSEALANFLNEYEAASDEARGD